MSDLKARVEGDIIIEYRELSDSEIPPHKVQYWRPVVDTNPTYDPLTQVSEGPIITVYEDRVERVWTVRDKTQEEQRVEVDSAVDRIDETQYAALLDLHARVCTLETGTVTPYGEHLRKLLKKEK